jgi:hypothetical protein
MISNKKELTQSLRSSQSNLLEKGNGMNKGYAVNTFHGMVKDYN